MTTIGSMCSGYGGLEPGVTAVMPGEIVWHAEIDPDASRVLAHHWPDVPNLGDLTAVDWSRIQPVDVLCAGFPCQPVSQAGLRQGTDDDRWLFDDIAAAIGRMDPRPRLLVFENVPGLLTANSGDAMARVVHSLAHLGYMGTWRTVRASDVGAPHRRERVFLVAYADGHGREGHSGTPQPELGAPRRHDPHRLGGSPADPDRPRLEGRGTVLERSDERPVRPNRLVDWGPGRLGTLQTRRPAMGRPDPPGAGTHRQPSASLPAIRRMDDGVTRRVGH